MVAVLIACERLGEHGELRSFRREGPPPHLAFEVLRDVDGRAWTLRIPQDARAALTALLRATRRRLASSSKLGFDPGGLIVLASERLTSTEEVAAVALEQEGELAFALWRRELEPQGWSWTLDALFVPAGYAAELCALIDAALAEEARSPA